MPAELTLRFFDVADQTGRVARSAGSHGMRHGDTGYVCRLSDDLTNAIARATSNVELLMQTGGWCTLQPLQCTEMCICQVADMDEIADAGAVRRRIVIA